MERFMVTFKRRGDFPAETDFDLAGWAKGSVVSPLGDPEDPSDCTLYYARAFEAANEQDAVAQAVASLYGEDATWNWREEPVLDAFSPSHYSRQVVGVNILHGPFIPAVQDRCHAREYLWVTRCDEESEARHAARLLAMRPRQVQERTCAHCGCPFQAVRADSQFCSSRCRTAAHRERKAQEVVNGAN